MLRDVELVEATAEEVTRAEERVGKQVERQYVFVLRSRGVRYLVVAAAMNTSRNEMDIFESPFE